MTRIRLDKLLLKRKFVDNLENATDLLESGQVLVNGATQKNPSSFVELGCSLELVKPKPEFVSRGGKKLQFGLERFDVDLEGKQCLDVGASTGGFTDCMLSAGAANVVAIDVGKGQLDDKIRNHPQVKIFEKFNAKDLTLESIGTQCSFAAIDVSFTSIIPLMDAIVSVLNPIEIVALIKPQFELSERYVDARGIVNDKQAHIVCIESILKKLDLRLSAINIESSPITGAKGNIEFLLHIVGATDDKQPITQSKIVACVDLAHEMFKKDK